MNAGELKQRLRGDLKAAMNLVRQAKESAPHAAGTARGPRDGER